MDWRYYNHAVTTTTAPHITPDITPLKDGSIWKITGGRALLVRWTSDFDCGYDTGWWYCIKDNPFDINELNAKRRYEINKGKKNFSVSLIDNPKAVKEDLFRVYADALTAYNTGTEANKEDFFKAVEKWKFLVFGAFDRNDGSLCGYALLSEFETSVDFNVLKVMPSCEKRGINAAIVAGICEHYDERLKTGFYISDGERNILHETAFQSYLEKYFQFRKAYCKLHIVYKPFVKLAVTVLRPFYPLLSSKKHSGIIKKVTAVLKMDKIKAKN